MSINKYLDNLDVSQSTITIQDQNRDGKFRDAKFNDKFQSAVVSGSVISFVDGISQQDTQDVLDTVQLASRAADKSFDRFTEVRNWYGKYLEVLENVGWVASQFAFSGYNQDEGDFHMDDAALSVISAIATGNQLAVLKTSIEALKKLSDGEKPIKVFEYYASSQDAGNFQLGAVKQGSTGSLTMAMGAFNFKSIEDRKKFLFFSWNKDQLNFWTAAQEMVLNKTFYAARRAKVKELLGNKANDFLANLEL